MIIIPARLASSRFHNKVLANIGGIPMVVRSANIAKEVDEAVVATDDKSIQDLCKRYGIDAILTSKEHQSGTDRIDEAAKILALRDDEIIINLQADEPFIEKEVLLSIKKRTEEAKQNSEDIMMVSCYKRIEREKAENPNQVKVVVDVCGYAIYFSRSIIPYSREDESEDYLGHLGVYGFTKKSLSEFCKLPSAFLERVEKLEQLRAIENGKKIAMVEVSSKSFGIDTIEDLKKAEEIFLG